MRTYINDKQASPEVRALWPVCYSAVQQAVFADHSDVNAVVLELSQQLAANLQASGLVVKAA